MTRPARVAALGALLSLSTLVSGCGFLGIGGDAPGDLQVYSARHYDLEDAFVEFEEETGLSVDFIYGDDTELLERLKAEGDGTPADVFMTVDAGNLWNAARQGELAPLDSAALEQAVPADLRDPEGRWFGLAMRARTVTYNPDNVDPAEFDTEETYAGLADPKWQGRICTRSGTHNYNLALLCEALERPRDARRRALQQVALVHGVGRRRGHDPGDRPRPSRRARDRRDRPDQRRRGRRRRPAPALIVA